VLDKVDRQGVSGDLVSAVQTVQGTLYQRGIPTSAIMPNAWSGRAATASYGLFPRVQITAAEAQGGCFIDLKISADFDTTALIVLVVAWMMFFPVAIVLAVLAYQDWERRTRELRDAVWASLSHRLMPPQATVAYAAQPSALAAQPSQTRQGP